MLKHKLSPPPSPPYKRVHYVDNPAQATVPTNFEIFSDELILYIFSQLDWVTLCIVQSANKNWARLATDNELWRRLYFDVFGRTRLRGAKGFIGRTDGREVKPLPGGLNVGGYKDWKSMFRISSNWRRGRCSVEHGVNWLPSSNDGARHQVHIIVAGSLTVTATAQPSVSPCAVISNTTGTTQTLPCVLTHPTGLEHVTTLAIDQSPPTHRHFRLAVFLSTGDINVFTVQMTQPPSRARVLNCAPSRRNERTCPIIQAVYHHPLLITVSRAFHLSIYEVGDGVITLTQTLSSFTSFPPTSLVLSMVTPTTYKLVVVYAIPVYPAHWSVGATEVIIAGLGDQTLQSSISSFSQTFTSPPPDPLTVLATRTVRTVDIPPGWIDVNKLRLLREQWARKVLQVSDTQTDGKWLVLAAADEDVSSEGSTSPPYPSQSLFSLATLQLYRLSFSPLSPSVSSPPPKLVYVRNLHGQTGPIASLAVADGRCVSLGANGGIWVWDLENGVGAEVASPDSSPSGRLTAVPKRSVVFDERRIITTDSDGVVVRRFDI
ncbi:hypothetical protein BDN72DRAFT_833941 [Pluteus cervinus]|uniref:Uncharacterized protein n=1 Tax=Pluteus cervinus TaxID=181527 RepID=A0ACD3B7Q1_9AGAR|nr:hypothetical protein BDN72DRAFT_833941 [Pluteus cervinus]